METPPSETIVVVGDQLAEWLAYGLEEVFADTPEVGVVRKIKFNAGLVRYEARADAPEWPQAIADILAAEKPSAIVVMLGINDRLPLRDRVPEKEKTRKKIKNPKPERARPSRRSRASLARGRAARHRAGAGGNRRAGNAAPLAQRQLRISRRQVGRTLRKAHR